MSKCGFGTFVSFIKKKGKHKGVLLAGPWEEGLPIFSIQNQEIVKMHFFLSHITSAPSLGITWGWSIVHTLWHRVRDSSMCEWAYLYGMSSRGLIELKVTNYHHRLGNFDVPPALPFLVQWESTHNFKIIVFNTKKLTKVMTYFLPKSKWIT